MSKAKEKKAFGRYKEYYYEHLEAKRYVDDLLNQGYVTPEALRQMRQHFAKEYFEWKQRKGYKRTWTDSELFKGSSPSSQNEPQT